MTSISNWKMNAQFFILRWKSNDKKTKRGIFCRHWKFIHKSVEKCRWDPKHYYLAMRGYVSKPIEYIVIALDISLAPVSQLEHAIRSLEISNHFCIFVFVKCSFSLSCSMTVWINRPLLVEFLELLQDDEFQGCPQGTTPAAQASFH